MKDTLGENRSISIGTSRVGNFVQLSVSDRGPGIAEDKSKGGLRTVLHQESGGHGHGLSVARTIIEAHHGETWAKNRDHSGATFRIELPLADVPLTRS